MNLKNKKSYNGKKIQHNKINILVKNFLYRKRSCYNKWVGTLADQIMTVRQTPMKKIYYKKDYSKLKAFVKTLGRRHNKVMKFLLKNVNTNINQSKKICDKFI